MARNFVGFLSHMRRLLAFLLLAAALSGCTSQQAAEPEATEEETENIDEGDFVLQMEAAPGELAEVEGQLRDWPVEQIITDLNDWIALPNDVTVILASTESPDDFYFDSEADEIVVSYEAVEQDRQLFEAAGNEGDDAWNAAITNFEFFLYHEVGHALVDNLELPITGKEEDAVDGFAALVVVELLEEGQDLLLNAADFSQALAESSDEVTEEQFADEHSLDEQRLYQFLCWVYGSDAEKYSWIVDDEYLPEARAERCEDEYQQNVAAWVTLLGDYFKPAAD